MGAQLIGDAVFFVRETAADNARLVLSQRIWTLALDPRSGIVQQSFLFKDPRRWRSAAGQCGSAGVAAASGSAAAGGLRAGAAEDRHGVRDHGRPDAASPIMPASTPSPRRRLRAGQAAAQPETEGCQPGREAQGLWIEQRASLSGRDLSLDERRAAGNGALESGDALVSLVLTRAASSTSP